MMTPAKRVFDTHCHLAGDELLPRAAELATNAYQNGVRGLALISADPFTLDHLIEAKQRINALGHEDLNVVLTSGIHPHDTNGFDDALKQKVTDLAETEAAAIGETGLDYFYDHSDRQVQRDAFAWHIALASRLKKPLVIHCREAADDIVSMLESSVDLKSHPNPGILHCFSENWDVAKKLIDLGFYISLSGILTFRNADPLREVARKVPLDRLLVETDSPWLAPIPQRGKRNEPAFVVHVEDCLTTLRSENPDLVREAVWNNSLRVFGLARG